MGTSSSPAGNLAAWRKQLQTVRTIVVICLQCSPPRQILLQIRVQERLEHSCLGLGFHVSGHLVNQLSWQMWRNWRRYAKACQRARTVGETVEWQPLKVDAAQFASHVDVHLQAITLAGTRHG